MKLYKISIKAYKVFYVEAESQQEALVHRSVQDEMHPNHTGKFEWEHDETDAKEIKGEEAETLRNLHRKLIADNE